MKNNKVIKQILMLAQAIILFSIMVFAIIGSYSKPFVIVWQILLMIELVILIINNIVIYHKKYMTLLYILALILVLTMVFL